jgi:FkbM family methyltransferase
MKKLVRVFNVKPLGILHIGAHEAEELDEYMGSGVAGSQPIRWIEANPELANNLMKNLDPKNNIVINAAVWDIDGEKISFNITSAPASSSLLDFGTHAEKYPDIEVVRKVEVTTRRVDSIFSAEDSFDFAVLDIQGAESRALAGFGKLIEKINWIYLEVAKTEIYVGSGTVRDLDRQLNELGFARVITFWQRKLGWGDALYIRKSLTSLSSKQSLAKWVIQLRWYSRSWIPEWAFPYLVKLKSMARRLAHK